VKVLQRRRDCDRRRGRIDQADTKAGSLMMGSSLKARLQYQTTSLALLGQYKRQALR